MRKAPPGAAVTPSPAQAPGATSPRRQGHRPGDDGARTAGDADTDDVGGGRARAATSVRREARGPLELTHEGRHARRAVQGERLEPPGEAPNGRAPPDVLGGMHAVDPKAAVDALRRRYEDSVAHARGKQSQDLVHAAEEAVAKGDFSTALQLYRSATSHNSNPALKAVLAETETKAKMQLHATAQDRAREAEQKQDYGDAGANWARAFDLVPSAETAQRASLCFRRAGTDPRRAAKYGEEAVKLDPHKASYRVNLALVYCDLGMALRARGEIERAHAIEPQNPQVKEAFARVKAMK